MPESGAAGHSTTRGPLDPLRGNSGRGLCAIPERGPAASPVRSASQREGEASVCWRRGGSSPRRRREPALRRPRRAAVVPEPRQAARARGPRARSGDLADGRRARRTCTRLLRRRYERARRRSRPPGTPRRPRPQAPPTPPPPRPAPATASRPRRAPRPAGRRPESIAATASGRGRARASGPSRGSARIVRSTAGSRSGTSAPRARAARSSRCLRVQLGERLRRRRRARPVNELVEHQAERVDVAADRDLARRRAARAPCRPACPSARPLPVHARRARAARPKSVRRALPRPSSMTLAGFRSRCRTPFSCAAASPAQSCRAISSALSRGEPADAPQQRATGPRRPRTPSRGRCWPSASPMS